MRRAPVCNTTIALLSTAVIALSYLMPAAAETLQGQVSDTERMRDTGTSLTRSEVDQTKADPYAGQEPEETLDASPQTFEVQQPAVPPKQFNLGANKEDQFNQKKKMFNLEADQTGGGHPGLKFLPSQPMVAPQPVTDLPATPDPAMTRPQFQQPPTAFNPTDPDASPDMMLAWDIWHRRVAATIFDRFNYFAKAAFRNSPPLAASLSYQVTRDGRIINMNMDQKSPNVLFNVLVYQCVKSLEHDMSVLTYPQGSRRMVVAKAGQFTQNFGQEGFRYLTGDRERIPGTLAAIGR